MVTRVNDRVWDMVAHHVKELTDFQMQLLRAYLQKPLWLMDDSTCEIRESFWDSSLYKVFHSQAAYESNFLMVDGIRFVPAVLSSANTFVAMIDYEGRRRAKNLEIEFDTFITESGERWQLVEKKFTGRLHEDPKRHRYGIWHDKAETVVFREETTKVVVELPLRTY